MGRVRTSLSSTLTKETLKAFDKTFDGLEINRTGELSYITEETDEQSPRKRAKT